MVDVALSSGRSTLSIVSLRGGGIPKGDPRPNFPISDGKRGHLNLSFVQVGTNGLHQRLVSFVGTNGLHQMLVSFVGTNGLHQRLVSFDTGLEVD